MELVNDALAVLYSSQDTALIQQANQWLVHFQQSDQAWSVAQQLLASETPQLQLFAAQTFRSKIVHDFDSLPPEQRIPLRDFILLTLASAPPRIIVTQLSLALVDLALQLTPEESPNSTDHFIANLGKHPEALLESLAAWAGEYNDNMKIVVRNLGGGGMDPTLGNRVIALLDLYVQTPGITPALQIQCFACLSAWLRTGQALALSLVDTPILASVFTSLDNPLLFDAAVDTLVDIIRETQELSENMLVIQELVGRLIALREVLARSETLDDSDRMRGYCRIFVEAGEWYEPLIVQHSSNFLPLVQAIQQCSAYEDLDVVGITLNFWYKLSKNVRRRKEDPEVQVLLEVFAGLVETIIGHLHYPADEGSLVGQERDDFRNFRHTIGDTLKDCCAVLSATVCLRRSYEILSATLAHAASKGVEPKWQDVEAPLFSMRSMGAEVDPSEEGIMPLIMDLLPQLPTHSKIRYATILVIGRYTVWIDRHPSYIPFHLSYVSAGFQESDDVEVYAAAAQTIKYLCKDCSTHLIPFIAQLHSFVLSIASKLAAEELSNLMEAMAYIIAVMPLDEAAAALQLFCAPELALLSAMAADGGTTQGKRELRLAGDALDRLDVMLSIVGPFDLPPSCAGTASQAWSVLSAFLIAYSSIPSLAEKSCTLLRRSLDFFGPAVPPLVPAILEQMTTSFEQTGASSFLWITGKIVGKFGREPGLEGLVGASFGRESEALFIMLGNKTPALVGDVLDDYIHLLSTLIEYTPQIPLSSPSFPSIFRTVLAALTLFSPSVISAALDLLRTILGHESLLDPTLSPSYPQFAQTIHTAVQSNSTQLIQLLLQELIKLEDETSSSVLTLFRVLALGFSDVLGREIPIALGGIEDRIVSSTEKIEFLQKFSTANEQRNPGAVKDSFTGLLRTAKKSRERARLAERTL